MSRAVLLDDVLDASDPRHHDGKPGRHGLERGHRIAIPQGGQYEDTGFAVELHQTRARWRKAAVHTDSLFFGDIVTSHHVDDTAPAQVFAKHFEQQLPALALEVTSNE